MSQMWRTQLLCLHGAAGLHHAAAAVPAAPLLSNRNEDRSCPHIRDKWDGFLRSLHTEAQTLGTC